MKKLTTHIILAVVIIACATAAQALTPNDVVIESWVGTGNSSAMLIVDFGPASFAFGYLFDGTKTGFDMVNDIAIATELNIVDDQEYGSHLINSFTYGSYSLTYDSATWSSTHWWEYWTGTNGSDFTSSWVGCGDRVVTNGSWDGWTWSPAYPEVGTAPDVPLVPEPSSLAAFFSLIGLAASSKLLRRR